MAELQLSQDEVRRLAGQAERERIARDLHDLLGHTLSMVVLKSELAGKLIARDPDAARAQIAEVEQVARQALGEVREAVSGYRRGDFEGELAATRLALLSAGIEVEAASHAPPRRDEVDHLLSMCLREASTNILRHADAGHVSVDLSVKEGTLSLAISDDGRGGIRHEGNGLRGIRERLEAFGGDLDIDSPEGAGTRLRLSLPAGWRAEADAA
nr:sensor histidine kinase [Lysobacter sp. CAU 1642]